MDVYIVVHGDSVIEFLDQQKAQIYAQTYGLSEPYKQVRELPYKEPREKILERLKANQAKARNLLNELYVENTLAGLSLDESNNLFHEMGDVILRINEGAFSVAAQCLRLKSPARFFTQELKDKWIKLLEDNNG